MFYLPEHIGILECKSQINISVCVLKIRPIQNKFQGYVFLVLFVIKTPIPMFLIVTKYLIPKGYR
jgi:hypothetical protein